MRNQEHEQFYRSIVNSTIEIVKRQYSEILWGIEFGAYIHPENYFLSYVFKTDADLRQAEESGLTTRINDFHKKILDNKQYPIHAIKDCEFASQETCDREYNGNWFYYYK